VSRSRDHEAPERVSATRAFASASRGFDDDLTESQPAIVRVPETLQAAKGPEWVRNAGSGHVATP
jgi:hypothetical protein